MKNNHHTPPRFTSRLLRWLLADDWETPAGDFEEFFNRLAETDGLDAAKSWYRRQVFGLLPGRLLEKTIWSTFMFFSNLKVAVRSLKRHKWYAAINIGGLAVGIAAALLIVLYIQDELSFDRQHAKSDRIGRIIEARTTSEGGREYFSYTFAPLGKAMVDEIPGIERSVTVVSRWMVGRQTAQFGDNKFYESEYLFTDGEFFDVFDFLWVAGNPETALSGPNKAVLTQSAVLKYFGDEDPIGKSFNIERDGDFTVMGVLADPPQNSHLQFSMLLSLDTYRNIPQWFAYMEDWSSQGFMTYVLLSNGADFEEVGAAMSDLYAARVSEETRLSRTPILQPLADVHFGSTFIDFDENAGRANFSTINIFALVAFFIVLIAGINYTNMATASSLQRAKEVGLRKSVGANKGQLVRQFLSESILTTAGAIVLAVCLAVIVLPLFNQITDKQLALSLLDNPGLTLTLMGLLAIIGILSGSYPAFLLSTFDPARVLKGRIGLKSLGTRVRKGLVIAQFTLSIGLIIASLVVSKQLDYFQEKKLGFNEEQIVVIDINDGNSRANFRSMKDDLMANAAVRSVSVSSNVPGDWKNIPRIDIEAVDTNPGAYLSAHYLGVDSDFLTTFEIELLEGRNISDTSASDSLSVLLNRTGAERLSVSLGERIQIPGGSLRSQYSETELTADVVGIVDDFNFMSLHEKVGPIVLGYYANPIDAIDYFSVRMDGADLSGTVDNLAAVGGRYDPRHPFEFNFLDERIADFYAAETRLGKIFSMATVLAILIACLGLFGLAAFTTAQRTKEIGVRKVLGASASAILLLLSKDILKLVCVSFLIAAPVTYFLMKQWLQGFAYQTNVGVGVLAAALALSIGFSFLTISYQSIRAAVLNPVDSLRYE